MDHSKGFIIPTFCRSPPTIIPYLEGKILSHNVLRVELLCPVAIVPVDKGVGQAHVGVADFVDGAVGDDLVAAVVEPGEVLVDASEHPGDPLGEGGGGAVLPGAPLRVGLPQMVVDVDLYLGG